MRCFIPLVFVPLIACSLPGRDDFAPRPVAAQGADIDAAQAFAGRVALVRIAPGTQEFAGPLKDAVGQALAIKPGAAFEVRAEAPGVPDAAAGALAGLAPLAGAVALAIAADGVAPAQVTLSAQSGGADTAVFVYVK